MVTGQGGHGLVEEEGSAVVKKTWEIGQGDPSVHVSLWERASVGSLPVCPDVTKHGVQMAAPHPVVCPEPCGHPLACLGWLLQCDPRS